MEFCSKHNNSKWTLTTVYAPCTPEGKIQFTNWLQNIHTDTETDWMILGDFNLIRKEADRNKPGGDINDMFRFNSAISSLGITEIPLQGKHFTWSNKQPSPLMEKLDWVFTSSSWAVTYPSTSLTALEMIPSDHCPCVVQISTAIPRNNIFRFENFWLEQQGFQQVLNQSWQSTSDSDDAAKVITLKFKKLRANLR